MNPGNHALRVIAMDDREGETELLIPIEIRDGNLSVIEPNSTTIWLIGQKNVNISWETGELGGNVSIELWKAERLGYSEPSAWNNMQDVLLNMGWLKEPIDLRSAYSNEFLP